MSQARSPRFRCNGRYVAVTLQLPVAGVAPDSECGAESGLFDYSSACTHGQILYDNCHQKRVGRTTAAALRVG